MRHHKSKFVEWMWRKAETVAVVTAMAWVWMWTNSPPGDGPVRRTAGLR